MAWGFHQRDFQRWPNDAFKQVPASCGSVAQSEHRMDMQAGLAIVAQRDIADRAQHFALFVDRDFAVGLRFQVKPADGRSLERTDGGQRSAADLLVDSESGKPAECFFAGLQHHNECLCPLTSLTSWDFISVLRAPI